MKLPEGLTPAEIRVLQEFRRIGTTTMTETAIAAIRHPADPGAGLAGRLVARGLVAPSTDGGGFELTTKGTEFLATNPEPEHDRWS